MGACVVFVINAGNVFPFDLCIVLVADTLSGDRENENSSFGHGDLLRSCGKILRAGFGNGQPDSISGYAV